VEKTMHRVEEKKQEKLVHKAVYGRKITLRVKKSTASVVNIGKEGDM
jgi:hypothetical protein